MEVIYNADNSVRIVRGGRWVCENTRPTTESDKVIDDLRLLLEQARDEEARAWDLAKRQRFAANRGVISHDTADASEAAAILTTVARERAEWRWLESSVKYDG